MWDKQCQSGDSAGTHKGFHQWQWLPFSSRVHRGPPEMPFPAAASLQRDPTGSKPSSSTSPPLVPVQKAPGCCHQSLGSHLRVSCPHDNGD